jgi:hypothetical protein
MGSPHHRGKVEHRNGADAKCRIQCVSSIFPLNVSLLGERVHPARDRAIWEERYHKFAINITPKPTKLQCSFPPTRVNACYGIASTQDSWALARARVIATRKLEAAGVPRTSISAGPEYYGWTQLLVNGQINDPWVKNPPNAFRPGSGATPAVVPGFVLEYKPTLDTEPTEFGAVPYFSMLPSSQRRVSTDRVLAGHPPSGLAIWKERYP